MFRFKCQILRYQNEIKYAGKINEKKIILNYITNSFEKENKFLYQQIIKQIFYQSIINDEMISRAKYLI